MRLSVQFGEAETEAMGRGRRVIGVLGDFEDAVVFARSFGKTSDLSLAVLCTVDFERGERGPHMLAASMRDGDGRPCGTEQRKEFIPPDYGVFPYIFWWPDASLPPGEYFVHVSLDGSQIETRKLRVLPHELNPRRAP